ncbi:MAG: C4-dicarboxylate ABC transporter, partial [Ahrensia sp.]
MRRMTQRLITGAVLAATLLAGGIAAHAQEVTLRLHQFLPPQSTVPAQLLTPWAQKVEQESDGRIKIEMFHAMALGGRPPELISQVRDGVVDIVYTLPGYTPGTFPRVELVELPFMGTDAETTSRVYWDLYDTEMRDTDFKDFHILATWVHGPGVLHTKGEAVTSLDD